jgi:DNA-binding transcriptional LysR family regulator
VLAHVHAAGVNPPDLYLREGYRALPSEWQPTASFPIILGTDVSGVVAAVGESALGFDLGNEVFAMVKFPDNLMTGVLVLSSLIMVRDAVRAGVGAARLPISLVSQDVADGTLQHWGDIEGSEIALWALYPSRRLLSARVSAFLDFLKQAFPKGTPEERAAYIGGSGDQASDAEINDV